MEEKNEIVYGKSFWNDVDGLPKETRQKLGGLLGLLVDNPFDSRLHTKLLGIPLTGKYSFRITRDWRVAFKFEGRHTIKLLIAGRRDQIYQRLKRTS